MVPWAAVKGDKETTEDKEAKEEAPRLASVDHWAALVDHWAAPVEHWAALVDHWAAPVERWAALVEQGLQFRELQEDWEEPEGLQEAFLEFLDWAVC